ncbi:hypothetical protein [Nocardia sp. NPDC051570]|uniref:hypothetical protein n=1 Tax=Nocardia sp. NPDC051570 TaxID=3364324 RepID=UPI0037AF28D9
MSNLYESTTCGQDGFDQSFGITRAVPNGRSAVKQGWSGFGDGPEPDKACLPGNPKPPIPEDAFTATATGPLVLGEDGIREKWSPAREIAATQPEINLRKRAMHTTGTVGAHDEKIIVLLTLEPTETPWDVSAQRLTLLTKAADVTDWGLASGLGNH